MTYVSRPVRHLREEPVPGEDAGLLLRTTDETDTDEVAETVREFGGEVVADRGFGTLEVEVDQEDVESVCEIDGLEAVETTDTLTIDLDGAGEDVEY